MSRCPCWRNSSGVIWPSASVVGQAGLLAPRDCPEMIRIISTSAAEAGRDRLGQNHPHAEDKPLHDPLLLRLARFVGPPAGCCPPRRELRLLCPGARPSPRPSTTR